MDISRKRRKLLEDDDDDDDDDDVHNMNKIKNNVSYITEDLIMNILLRLPPISVFRFQRVCKQWYTLISCPDFLRTHSSPFSLHNSSTTPHEHNQFLVFTKSSKVEYVPFTHFEDRKPSPPIIKRLRVYLPPGGYKFIDSCNGLFLFQHRRKRANNMARTYYIYNPITKKYFKLPDVNSIPNVKQGDDLIQISTAKLVFEPSISFSYKVIRMLKCANGHRPVYWQIYSSEIGSWRLLSTTIPDPRYTIQFVFKSVLLNGVLYWFYLITRWDVSLCFDIEKESVWCLPLPPKPEHSFRSCRYLSECGGRLRLIETFVEDLWVDHPKLPCSFDIMETEPEPEQPQDGVHCTWTVKYRVNIASVYDLLGTKHVSIVHCYKTKNRRENEEEEEELMLLRLNDRWIVSFNLTSNKIIKEIVYPESAKVCDFKDTFAYTPTLFPVS